ncbi:hypothetical protein [Cupriavidus sp. TMH.W2]|uniref:hypothetical protein n=1 Tax=Cupriavidus sp. TMH.W2 TaxID=3434465 RepID=UPI003D76BF40
MWIVDRKSGLFRSLNYGRFYSKGALEENPNMTIPDKFASRALCSPIDIPKLMASDFVLLDKRPTDDDEGPYCYEPTYLTIKMGKLVIRTNRRTDKCSDSDHVAHEVPARDRVRLIHLLDAARNCRATVR